LLRRIDHRASGRVIRVLVVSAVRLHREGLVALLGRDARLRVTGVAPTAEGVLAAGPADVVVLGTATREEPASIRRLADVARKPIVALGVPDDEHRVIAFAESGVLGFVECEASLDELVASIVSAAHGHASFPPRIATALLRRVGSMAGRTPSPELAALTVRERQIVQIIAEGLTNKEIAARLSIEVATVKNHVHNILEKLQVNRRSDAVARLRLVESDEFGPPAARSTIRTGAG
jgi:two-component system, NarL family, nitrate/nitrite response regulator NarL